MNEKNLVMCSYCFRRSEHIITITRKPTRDDERDVDYVAGCRIHRNNSEFQGIAKSDDVIFQVTFNNTKRRWEMADTGAAPAGL